MYITCEFERPDKAPSSVALGLFDGIHIGHQAVLRRALENPELVPCVFTFTILEDVPGIKKNYSALLTEQKKWSVLEDMGFQVAVCPAYESFKELSPKEFVEEMLIRRLNAKEITCGYDFTFGKGAGGKAEDLIHFAAPYGVKVNLVEPVLLDGEPVSSTRIREAIQQGRMEQASRMLGRRFSIDYEVEHGNQIGRIIQFPTINQVFPERHIVPKYGVYATVVRVGSQLYGGVTNVGVKPTVGSSGPLAETYIMDFDGDLYGRRVEVFFFRFVRSETKFASIEELKAQITKDKAAVQGDTAGNIAQLQREWNGIL